MYHTLKTNFKLQDKVMVDGDTSIIGYVTGILWSANGVEVRIAYIHNGDNKAFWIEEWRLTSA